MFLRVLLDYDKTPGKVFLLGKIIGMKRRHTPSYLVLAAAICTLPGGCGDGGSIATKDHDEAGGPHSPQASQQLETLGEGRIEFLPLESPEVPGDIPGTDTTRFVKMDPAAIGIDFVASWSPPERYRMMIARSFSGAGVTVGDIDQDGLVDLYLPRPFGGGRLYRNLGGFRFEDVTTIAGLSGDTAWGSGASFVDIDGDGDLDLYVCGFDCPNRLFVNDGSGFFEERAAEAGLDFVGASVMMAFADYDNDGDMDGFLVTNRHSLDGQRVGGDAEAQRVASRITVVDGRLVIPPDIRELYGVLARGGDQATIIKVGQYARLYRNNGDGTFSEVAKSSGIFNNGLSLSATWWDYNHDGFPDLYLANDFYGEDKLYHNNGDGTFRNVIRDVVPHTPWFSMGSDIGDIDNDGLIDLVATDMSGSSHFNQKIMGGMSADSWFLEYGNPRQYMRNAVYLNTRVGRVREVAHMTGLSNTDWTWSPKFGDLDNDGDLDLFVTNGMSADWGHSDLADRYSSVSVDEVLDRLPQKLDRNLAFDNMRTLHFRNAAPEWGLDAPSASYGATLADLDNDGDLDIVTNNFDAPPLIYRNDTAGPHRVMVSLRGVISNRFGIGARVRIEAGGQQQTRYLTLSRGFMSTNDCTLHFGLGEHDTIDLLEVIWPSGAIQRYTELTANQHFRVYEGDTANGLLQDSIPGGKEQTPHFVGWPSRVLAHSEAPFDDFAAQPLLPNRVSMAGPGISVGDVDDDGDEDLYLSGAAGRPGRLFYNDQGRYDLIEPQRFLDASNSEDMGSLFFDADRDGDLDLYVVSGGVECEPGSDLLRDRLYLNDGSGRFSLAPEGTLPDISDSGSCVTGADVDRDGDLDLFVGGRVVPGRYPVSPNSRLLLNESSEGAPRFIDATSRIAPGLLLTGMVTSSLWSDVNNDGWIDLVVAHDWGPIKLFLNHEGIMHDATEQAGLLELTGWWRGLAAADIDSDGDIDFVATNLGTNSKYHPDATHPVQLYYNELGGNYHLVEAKVSDEGLLPIRGRF